MKIYIFLIYCCEGRRIVSGPFLFQIDNIDNTAPLYKLYTCTHIYIHVQYRQRSISSMFVRLNVKILAVIKIKHEIQLQVLCLQKLWIFQFFFRIARALPRRDSVHCTPCLRLTRGLTVPTKIYTLYLSCKNSLPFTFDRQL